MFPPHAPGLRIGLFGGTFDPPHDAHLGAALLALKKVKLDRIWWMVTPGNPLKDTRGLAPLENRIKAVKQLTQHPRIDVTGLESVIHTRYTYDTVRYLTSRFPHVHFVWIMGADNLRSFHRWQKWRGIAKLVPMVVIDRLGPSLYAPGGVAGQALSAYRIPEAKAASLAFHKPPAWIYLHGLKSPLSSTALRAARRKVGPNENTSKAESSGKKRVKKTSKKSAKKPRKKPTKKFARKAAVKKKAGARKTRRRAGGKKR